MQRLIGFLAGMTLVAVIVLVGSNWFTNGKTAQTPVEEQTPVAAGESFARAAPVSPKIAMPTPLPAATGNPQVTVAAVATPPPAATSTTPDAAVADNPQPQAATVVVPQIRPLTVSHDTAVADAAPAPLPEQLDALPADAFPATAVAAETAAPQWHTFWRPFRSKLSAKGFTERLEQVTGLDYRIVSLKPGYYQVAFAFVDESERDRNIASIESATGLRLRGGTL